MKGANSILASMGIVATAMCLIAPSVWAKSKTVRPSHQEYKKLAESELAVPTRKEAPHVPTDAMTLPLDPPLVSTPYRTEIGLLWQKITPGGRVPFITKDEYELSKTGSGNFYILDLTQPIWTFKSSGRVLGGGIDVGYSTRSYPVQSSRGFLIKDVRLTILMAGLRPYFEQPLFWRFSGLINGMAGYVLLTQSDPNNVSNWLGQRWLYGGGVGLKMSVLSWFYLKTTYENRQLWGGTKDVTVDTHNLMFGAGLKL